MELHGNRTYAHCLSCGKEYDLEPIRETFLAHRTLPVAACGGFVKTATISFGPAMPQEEMRRATAEAMACDLFLAIRSSLKVYPAAGLPALAKQETSRHWTMTRFSRRALQKREADLRFKTISELLTSTTLGTS